MNSEQVCTKAGITKRQLDSWVERGWVVAMALPGVGRGGIERAYTAGQADVAVRMGGLVTAGLYPAAAFKVASGHTGPISALLAAVQPCMGPGELRYSLQGKLVTSARIDGE